MYLVSILTFYLFEYVELNKLLLDIFLLNINLHLNLHLKILNQNIRNIDY